ncbi:hypothetical protein [Microbispora rosea]|nr:hypothetical protein [Microbispora rosea]
MTEKQDVLINVDLTTPDNATAEQQMWIDSSSHRSTTSPAWLTPAVIRSS